MTRIGCCGFPKRRTVYFGNFNCVELQNTFYQPPQKLETFYKLREEAPPAFEFTVKAWQIITHPKTSPTYRRLKKDIGNPHNYGFFKPTKEVFAAFRRIYEVANSLKAKIILFQTPPNFKENKENIDNMYKFFSRIEKGNLTFCWEERSSFKDTTIRRICKDLNLIHVVDPFKKEPVWGDFLYFRLHGKGGYRYKYTKKDLKYLKRLVERSSGYVFFNNIYMWEDALSFKKMIS